MWTMNWVVMLAQYIEATGDRSILRELYGPVCERLEYYRSLLTPDGGILTRSWNLVDWAALDISDYCVCTAYQGLLAYCFDCAARFAANTARPSSRLSTTAPRRPPGRSCSQDCTFSKGRAFIMRNYEQELENRVAFIRQLLKESGCEGIVYGNSGGKDSALVGILCKKACGNTVGILLPCATTQNYGSDTDDAIRVAEQYGIAYRTVDLSETRGALVAALEKAGVELNNAAVSNIAPRLRMTALYAVAAAEHRLVAGTGNRSEAFMGYCTKWGDAAADFNPIADLSVTEVFEFLDYLDAPETIRHKAPSAGLFEGQTDEKEMGVSYAAIDRYMDGGAVTDAERAIIERFHRNSEHKRVGRKDYCAN